MTNAVLYLEPTLACRLPFFASMTDRARSANREPYFLAQAAERFLRSILEVNLSRELTRTKVPTLLNFCRSKHAARFCANLCSQILAGNRQSLRTKLKITAFEFSWIRNFNELYS